MVKTECRIIRSILASHGFHEVPNYLYQHETVLDSYAKKEIVCFAGTEKDVGVHFLAHL